MWPKRIVIGFQSKKVARKSYQGHFNQYRVKVFPLKLFILFPFFFVFIIHLFLINGNCGTWKSKLAQLLNSFAIKKSSKFRRKKKKNFSQKNIGEYKESSPHLYALSSIMDNFPFPSPSNRFLKICFFISLRSGQFSFHF